MAYHATSSSSCTDNTSWVNSANNTCTWYTHNINYCTTNISSICCDSCTSSTLSSQASLEIWSYALFSFLALTICVVVIAFIFACKMYKNERRKVINAYKTMTVNPSEMMQPYPTNDGYIDDEEYVAIPGAITMRVMKLRAPTPSMFKHGNHILIDQKHSSDEEFDDEKKYEEEYNDYHHHDHHKQHYYHNIKNKVINTPDSQSNNGFIFHQYITEEPEIQTSSKMNEMEKISLSKTISQSFRKLIHSSTANKLNVHHQNQAQVNDDSEMSSITNNNQLQRKNTHESQIELLDNLKLKNSSLNEYQMKLALISLPNSSEKVVITDDVVVHGKNEITPVPPITQINSNSTAILSSRYSEDDIFHRTSSIDSFAKELVLLPNASVLTESMSENPPRFLKDRLSKNRKLEILKLKKNLSHEQINRSRTTATTVHKHKKSVQKKPEIIDIYNTNSNRKKNERNEEYIEFDELKKTVRQQPKRRHSVVDINTLFSNQSTMTLSHQNSISSNGNNHSTMKLFTAEHDHQRNSFAQDDMIFVNVGFNTDDDGYDNDNDSSSSFSTSDNCSSENVPTVSDHRIYNRTKSDPPQITPSVTLNSTPEKRFKHQRSQHRIYDKNKRFTRHLSKRLSIIPTTKDDFLRASNIRLQSQWFNKYKPSEIKYSDIDFKNSVEIGRGAFGNVLQAKYHNIDVAVKILHTQNLSIQQMNNFRREAALMQKVGGHKHIARIYGICTEPGHVCIITEFYSRGSIHDILVKRRRRRRANTGNFNQTMIEHILRGGGSPSPCSTTKLRTADSVQSFTSPTANGTCIKMIKKNESCNVQNENTMYISLDLHRKLKMAVEASLGIGHLHEMSIIHRDISARNLLVDHAFTVVVADLGMSQLKSSLKKISKKSKKYDSSYTDNEMLPVKWLAPECISYRHFSEKSDAYAFGITLYEIFCECDPYPTLKSMEAACKVVNSGLRPNLQILLNRNYRQQQMKSNITHEKSRQNLCLDSNVVSNGSSRDVGESGRGKKSNKSKVRINVENNNYDDDKQQQEVYQNIAMLMEHLWHPNLNKRPDFKRITQRLLKIQKMANDL